MRLRARVNGGARRLRCAMILGLAVVSLAWVSGCGRDKDGTAAKAGCGSDNDCKGDRICVQGACTDPPAARAPAVDAEAQARPEAKELRLAVRKLSWYRSRYQRWSEQHPGTCPGNLGELAGAEIEPQVHVDPWGRPFVMKCGDQAPEGHAFGVMSLGPDGEEGTDDDLQSW